MLGAAFWGGVANIFVDPCHWVLFDPRVGRCVEELASGWAKVPAVEVTSTRNVTVEGHVGRDVEFTVPNYNEEDSNGMFYRCNFGPVPWPNHCLNLLREDFLGGSYPKLPDGSNQALPDQHRKIWILDVDGARLMISAGACPDATQQDRGDRDDIGASIEIG